MSKLFQKPLKMACRMLLAVLAIQLSTPILMAQTLIQSGTDISLGLDLKPTNLVISPLTVTVAEASAPIQFTAVAQYNYPDLVVPIPDKDVTGNPNVVWSSNKPDVALVNTIGLVTPVSDLNMGTAEAQIKVDFIGLNAVGTVNVTGVIPTPPPTSGGGGGSIFGQGPSEGGLPVNGSPTDLLPTENVPPAEGDPIIPTQQTNPPVEQTPPPTEQPVDGGQPTDSGQPSTTTNGQTLAGSPSTQPGPDNTYLPFEIPPRAEEISPIEEVFNPNELSPQSPEIKGTSRTFVVNRIAEKLKILELRKPLLDKCLADLNNCTNIFRMFSTFEGINLDPDNLKLFPDLDNVPEKENIEKMALLGIVQGYYGIEHSPFLPDKTISRAESLKILISLVETLEKGDSNYVADPFDFNSLFYQEIYAASLLSRLSNDQGTLIDTAPAPLATLFKIAHALTEEGYALIRTQKTVFSDIRPDLYDLHWYYPIVYNRICKLQIMACDDGSEAKPDESPSADEIDQLIGDFDKYIKSKNLDTKVIADEDDDGIINIDENLIYLINSRNADTDGDGLKDGEELITYKTDPNKIDTDDDGLTDGDEIEKHQTDPNLYDTDGDSFSDAVEISAGSDPLDKDSTPDDKNGNGVADSWETKYNLTVVDGSQDTDGDGVSDVLEYRYGTDPTRIDTDMDGYTDSEEILDFQSNPLDAASPGNPADWPVLINNYQYGQVITDPSPMIKGVGPASLGDNVVQIQILLRNEFGSELMLGSTSTDAKGKFIFIPDIEIKDGTYFLLARSINKGEVKLSKPIMVIIDSTLEVAAANLEKLEKAPITEEVLLKNLTLKIDSQDGQPVLYGNLSEFDSKVNITWQSLVVSSALIADTTDGSFSIKAPLLAEGQHRVYIQTIRKRDNAVGKTIKINFNLGLVSAAQAAQMNDAGSSSLQGVTAVLADFVRRQSWPFWVATVVVLILIGGGVYIFALDNDSKKPPKKKK